MRCKGLGLFLAAAALLAAGCRTAKTPGRDGGDAFGRAVAAIAEGRASCLLVSEGRILGWRRGRGLDPLLELYDRNRERFAGGQVADKVIGRAAAFILVGGGVSRAYGALMSEDARELLERHGVRAEWGRLVPRILNRSRDGLCPLERSVQGIEDSGAALAAIRRRLAELKAGRAER